MPISDIFGLGYCSHYKKMDDHVQHLRASKVASSFKSLGPSTSFKNSLAHHSSSNYPKRRKKTKEKSKRDLHPSILAKYLVMREYMHIHQEIYA
jgi:hypothetical protein